MGSASEETFRLVLLGKTGSGKSSTGNTILGQDLFEVGTSFTSVTTECQLKSATNHGVRLEVVDTPGLFDTQTNQAEIFNNIMTTVVCMHPEPHVLLMTIKVGRYTEEEYVVYNRLKALLDENVTRYLILVFTHGDALKGRSIEGNLSELPPHLKQVLDECRYRYVVFNNTNTADKQSQVIRLLDSVRRLQASNRHVPYTCPKYASVRVKMEEEVNWRLAKVEEKELQSKKYVQELFTKLNETKLMVQREKEEFQRKDEERHKAAAARKEKMWKQMGDLSEALKQQLLSEEEQWRQMMSLKEKLDREQQDFRKQMEQQRQQAEELRRKDEKREAAMKPWQAEKETAEKAAAERVAQEMAKLRQEIARCGLAKK